MKEDLIKVLISFILFIISICIPFNIVWINTVLYVISYLIVGTEVICKAIKNIFKGELFDECFLMSIATIGAICIGELPEAVTVMLFYQVGEMFQDYAVDKSKKSISNLMNIRPDFANIERNGTVEKVSPEDVNVGDIIIVKPGEKVPLDGIVVEGESILDTSALTGESMPTQIEKNMEVLSGSINKTGLFSMKVTKEFGESTVSKILNLVENASNRKSKSENFITKFAKIYTPTVVVIAIMLAVIPPFIFQNGTFIEWLYRALSFLVVSCPCALVISIPLGFFGGIGGASKAGILVKGSNYLEALAKTQIVVFDKTGTLTKGIFEVQKVEATAITKEELIKYVAYAENYSNHPISISVKNEYKEKIDTSLISSTQELAGYGVEANIDGKDVLVGNSKLMKERKINYLECNEIGTVLYVAIDSQFVGYILIADKIKEDSKKAVEGLKKNGIKKVIMLTGDKKDIAEKVASELKLDMVYSELLPNEKVERVEELLKEKNKDENLIFVGDGVNDAPVLAISDIGIAMGALGSDAAIEASDIVIMTDEPSKIEKAIEIAKKTLKIVKENIAFAIFVKIAVLILTAFGIATMWEAVFADVGVSVIAVLNALRTLRVKK